MAMKPLEVQWPIALNGRRSVPQIFINNQHVGGCDDIHKLDGEGQLDPLLAQPAV